MRIPLFKNILH